MTRPDDTQQRRLSRIAMWLATWSFLGACSTVAEAPPTRDQAPVQPTAAGSDTTHAPSAAKAGSAADDGVLDESRQAVRGGVEWLARGIDSWFGDRPFDPERAVRDGRLGIRTSWREDEGFDYGLRFRARFDPPNLREKAFVFIGRDVERDIVTDTPAGASKQEQLQKIEPEDRAFFLGLGKDLSDYVQLRAGVRGGLKFYAQARYERLWTVTARDRLTFRETLYWTVDDRLGTTTTVSADHAFSPSMALRWLNSGTLSQESDGFEWSSNLGLHKSFGPLTLLSTEALISGQTGSDIAVSDYGVRVTWRQPLYRDWLLGEFIVGYFWPRDDAQSPRTGTPAFGLSVEMRF